MMPCVRCHMCEYTSVCPSHFQGTTREAEAAAQNADSLNLRKYEVIHIGAVCIGDAWAVELKCETF